jgi:hypothetical protein
MMASEETVLMLSQWFSAALILSVKGWRDFDARMWALVLIVQSIPYLAALTTAMISALPTENVMRWLRRNNKVPPLAPTQAAE